MADVQALKNQLEDMATKMVADPNTSGDALRFLFQWKALAAAMAEERAAEASGPGAAARAPYVPRPKNPNGPKPFEVVKAKVLDTVSDVLRANPAHPMKTAAIFDRLPPEIAALIPGAEPKSNLSAMMHNSKRFKSYGREGWMLPTTEPVGSDVEDLLG